MKQKIIMKVQQENKKDKKNLNANLQDGLQIHTINLYSFDLCVFWKSSIVWKITNGGALQ